MFAVTQHRSWSTALLAVLAALGTVGNAALAGRGAVNDRAGFFSAKAVEKANAEIARLYQTHKMDLLVETYAALPSDKSQEFAQASKKAQDEIILKWARENAQKSGISGVYVLIVKSPGKVRVLTNKAANAKLPSTFKQELVNVIINELKAKNYDAVLDKTIALADQALTKTPATTAATSTDSSDWSDAAPSAVNAGKAGDEVGSLMPLLVMGGLAIGGILILVMIMRALSGGMGAGGGGLLGGLLAGMGGAMLGSWMYDSFFGNNAGSGADPSGGDAGGGDWSDAGGDWGGGGDAGGDF